jgi:acetoin utilization protein AcuB
MFVKDRMTKHPLTIHVDESVSAAHKYMKEQKVRHLPVVDKAGRMIGLVTEDDLLRAGPSQATSLSVWEIHYLLQRVQVGDAMVKRVVTATEDTPIEEAAQVMLEQKIGCLPVMRGDKLVGIITESDVFRTFMELFAARRRGLRVTMEVPDKEGELVLVAQAVTDLEGYIAACGAFASEDPTMAGLVLKVQNTDREALVAALSQIEGARIVDVREQ